MLTLVERQPGITAISSSKVMRLCRQVRRQCGVRAHASARRWHGSIDRLLADIGLTREAQMVECSKLFWWSP